MKKEHWFKIYFLPGFVFQSLVIAGGYATGRELVEFFLSFGPWTELLAMLVTTLIWSLVIAATSVDMMLHAFGIAPLAGTLLLMVSIGILTFYGSTVIEKFMPGWSFVLYGVYAMFLVWGVSRFLGPFHCSLPPARQQCGLSFPQ